MNFAKWDNLMGMLRGKDSISEDAIDATNRMLGEAIEQMFASLNTANALSLLNEFAPRFARGLQSLSPSVMTWFMTFVGERLFKSPNSPFVKVFGRQFSRLLASIFSHAGAGLGRSIARADLSNSTVSSEDLKVRLENLFSNLAETIENKDNKSILNKIRQNLYTKDTDMDKDQIKSIPPAKIPHVTSWFALVERYRREDARERTNRSAFDPVNDDEKELTVPEFDGIAFRAYSYGQWMMIHDPETFYSFFKDDTDENYAFDHQEESERIAQKVIALAQPPLYVRWPVWALDVVDAMVDGDLRREVFRLKEVVEKVFGASRGFLWKSLWIALAVLVAVIVPPYLFLFAGWVSLFWGDSIAWSVFFTVLGMGWMAGVRHMLYPWLDTRIPILMEKREGEDRNNGRKLGAKFQLTFYFLLIAFLEPEFILWMVSGWVELKTSMLFLYYLPSLAATAIVLTKMDLSQWIPLDERMQEAAKSYYFLEPGKFRYWVNYMGARSVLFLLVAALGTSLMQQHLLPASGRFINASGQQAAVLIEKSADKVEGKEVVKTESTSNSGEDASQSAERERQIREALCDGGRTQYCDSPPKVAAPASASTTTVAKKVSEPTPRELALQKYARMRCAEGVEKFCHR